MLRPTFLSFETARKSISTAQFGLDTVGHNIANIETPGYSRQRVDQVSFALSPNARYSIYGKQLPGQGSEVTGINRIRDQFLDNRYRIETTNYAELATKAGALADINQVFDEIESDGLHAKFDKLIDAFAKLETKVDSSEFKLVVRTEAEQIALMMNKYMKDLNNVERQQASDFATEVSDLSKTLKQLAYLNEQIEQQHIYGNPANELMDDRDLLLDRLSEMTDIVVLREEVKISEERSIERIVVKMNDHNGATVLNGKQYAQFELDTASTDPYALKMKDLDGKYISTNANSNFEEGSIRAFLDTLNGKGNFAADGENGTRGIPYFRASFNSFAQTFADQMNWLNAGALVDGAGDPIIPAPDASTNLFTYDPTKPGETLAITADWRESLDHLRTHTDDEDPKFVLKFKEALSKTSHAVPNGTAGGAQVHITGTFQQFLVAFSAEMGTDLNMAQSMLASSEVTLSALMDNREAVSGVSMNEESINMMTYQNYYNAALRYMTTLDEALNQIINQMGLVGR